MFVIIDKEQLKMVAAARKRSHTYLILEVDFPDIDSLVCNAHDGTTWTSLTREQMDRLYKNMSGLEHAPEYGECIEQLRAYVLQWDDYHKSEAELEAELAATTADEDIPADDPIQQQIAANKALRAAHQATIEAVEHANGDPEKKPEIAKLAPKPVKAAPTQGITKRVWTIADAVYAANPGAALKEVRRRTMELCHEEGVNPGTAATQYGRWKSERGYA